jgi:hypothetical protein
MRSSKVLRIVFLVLAVIVMAYSVTPALAITISVPGNAGPWDPVLNSAFDYGLHDQASPAIVDAASGLSFGPGANLTVQYLSGTVSVGSGLPFTDALGLTTTPLNDSNTGNGVAPSFYINPSSYPIFSGELVGTFASQNGVIVGSPFVIANGPLTVVVPTGANRLQMGINDNLYSDNVGAYTISVTAPSVGGPVVPEPASAGLLALGIATLLLGTSFGKIRKSFSAT